MAFNLTRELVTEGSELPKVMVKGTERIIIGLACQDADQRAKVLFGMGVMLSHIRPEHVVFSAIAWCSKQFLRRPSEAPDREEVVLVGWKTREGKGGSRALPFTRVGKEFIWGGGYGGGGLRESSPECLLGRSKVGGSPSRSG